MNKVNEKIANFKLLYDLFSEINLSENTKLEILL
jgi:hypothetical protein